MGRAYVNRIYQFMSMLYEVYVEVRRVRASFLFSLDKIQVCVWQ